MSDDIPSLSESAGVARQHFFPAAVLGNFSFDRRRRGRKSPLWVLRRRVDRPFPSAAEKIAYRHDFYVPFDDSSPADVEKIWGGYERGLPAAIDRLVTDPSSLDAATWTRILVPFVGAALVRAPEFRDRFKARMPGFAITLFVAHVGWEVTRDISNT